MCVRDVAGESGVYYPCHEGAQSIAKRLHSGEVILIMCLAIGIHIHEFMMEAANSNIQH